MATVTGFTAERMLVIENESVVDGEVQGDNLILITREGTQINAGNVRGPVGPVGPPNDVEPVGVMKMWAATAASIPVKYLPCDGTTRLIASFPDLAALLGSLWGTLTGTTFTLPNFTDYFPKGGATPGATGGFADLILPSHFHAQPSHSHTPIAHSHTINHDHAAANTGNDLVNHDHGAYGGGDFVVFRPGWGTFGIQGTGVNVDWAITTITTGVRANHYHTLDVPNFGGSSGNATVADGAAGAENTGSTGVSPNGQNIPPFKVVPFMIRALP